MHLLIDSTTHVQPQASVNITPKKSAEPAVQPLQEKSKPVAKKAIAKKAIAQKPAAKSKSYSKMKIAELKAVLRERGLSLKGKKAELVARLEADEAEDDIMVSHTHMPGANVQSRHLY